MGKPQATQSSSRKDSFFIGKKQNRPENRNKKTSRSFNDNSAGRDEVFSKESGANAGSFFVTPAEKQQILQEKEAKKNANVKFQPERERAGKSNRSGDDKPKKLFDKKKWRLQKYSKKYKLQQWEEKRKKTVLHQYYREIKDDEPKFDVQKIYEKYQDEDDDSDSEQLENKQDAETENENNLNRDITAEQKSTEKEDSSQFDVQPSTSQTKKKKAYKKAHLEYQRIQDEKRQKKEELAKQKIEKAEALQQYKLKKLERYKKLHKKTKKGQPIMKHRMEMLLEQIQKSVQ